ncbi:GNAT family N-acetyltransferase [Microbulbifer sp. CnH-101-G]|uniref:GNAT family N-acetyltransferase n=1 Tax=Microbulbifer sp. CnH-101-G TaxID=3243393 RepID=UPI0040391504
MDDELFFSKEKSDLDLDLVSSFLSNSYWALGRNREEVVRSIENSFCVGLFFKKSQIGFARVVTDYQTFAYIMDVFIVPEHQGKGFGKKIMQFMLQSQELQYVSTFRLRTEDAHGFYEGLGFKVNHIEILELARSNCV